MDRGGVSSLVGAIQFRLCFLSGLILASLCLIGLRDGPRLPPFDHGRVVEVVGTVLSLPEEGDGFLYFRLGPGRVIQKNRSIPLSGYLIGVYINTSSSDALAFGKPAFGETIRIRSYLLPPTEYGIPGVVDRKWQAAVYGIPYRIQLKSMLQLERLGISSSTGKTVLYTYVARFLAHLEANLDPESAALGAGLLLGIRDRKQVELRNRVIRLGIGHLFVVSGFHVALVAFFIRFLCPLPPALQVPVSIGLIWLYILASGIHVSAQRAGVMASLLLWVGFYGIRIRASNLLGLAALITLIHSPFAVFQISFQFSYLCILSFLLYKPSVFRPLTSMLTACRDINSHLIRVSRAPGAVERRRFRYLLEQELAFLPPGACRLCLWAIRVLLFVALLWTGSLAVQIVTLPLALYYWNLWCPLQPFLNVVFVPVTAVITVLCLALFACFWTPFGEPLIRLLELVSRFLLWLVEVADQWTPVFFYPQPTVAEFTAYYLLLLVALTLCRYPALTLFWPFLLVAWLSGSPNSAPGNLQVTLLDVGQGEAIHIVYPDGRSALVDTGGFPQATDRDFVGRQLVARYLWQRRIKELQYVLLTHPDTDHVQGFHFLKRVFSIKNTFTGGSDDITLSPGHRRLHSGHRFEISGVTHTVLHPPPNFSTRNLNDTSLVLLLKFQEIRILLTGDLTAKFEPQVATAARKVDLLKVAHHGSKSSTTLTFLGETRPTTALVSAGRRNRFGHPAAAVLQRLRKQGTAVYSTSAEGSLRYLSDGKKWRLYAYRPGTERWVQIDNSNWRSSVQKLR